ncbi:MAG: hypothetical protein ACNA7V_13140, partial [Bacteroidales bacterium]
NIRNTSASGTIVYQESHSQTTNALGMLNLSVGSGTPTVGAFSAIDWRNNSKFIEVLIDPAGGTSYVSMGSAEIVSVPYSLFSKNSEDSYWNKLGSDVFYESGNVGIGGNYFTNLWGAPPVLAIHGANGAGLYSWDTNSDGPDLTFHKSRGGSAGVHVPVIDHDELAFISFGGSDGTAFQESASIGSHVDGSVTLNSVPGTLQFYTTAAGNQYSDERMRIASNGFVGIGTTSPVSKLHLVDGDIRIRQKPLESSIIFTNASDQITWQLYIDPVDASFRLWQGDNYPAGSDKLKLFPNGNLELTGNLDAGGFSINGVPIGTSGDSYWIASGNNIYYNTGNIGIGTASPQYRLDVLAPGTSSTGIAVFRNSLGENKVVLRQNSNGCGAVNIYNGANTAAISLQGEGSSYLTGGYFGIGTTSPGTNLVVKSSGYTHGMYVYSADDQLIFRIRENSDESGSVYLYDGNGVNTLGLSGNGNSFIKSGSFGIGTNNPAASLHVTDRIRIGEDPSYPLVYGELIHTGGGTGFKINANAGGGGWGDLYFQTNGDTKMFIESAGNVGIGTTTPTSRLDVRGNITVRNQTTGDIVVELGTGLDFAEGFNVTDRSDIAPGTVLCIDEKNPGYLKISSENYDSKVAGIVAGANNLGSGISLGTGTHDFNVALAGRVYCNVDATNESIEVGDLLTTSSNPGYAMKVTDREKARDAILGKAMEGLKKGQKGQILVLVTLQ